MVACGVLEDGVRIECPVDYYRGTRNQGGHAPFHGSTDVVDGNLQLPDIFGRGATGSSEVLILHESRCERVSLGDDSTFGAPGCARRV